MGKYYYCTKEKPYCQYCGHYIDSCFADRPQDCKYSEPVPEDDLWLFEETEDKEEP